MEIIKARYKHNQRPAKTRRPRRFAVLLIVFALLASISGYGAVALTSPLPVLSAQASSIEALQPDAVNLRWPLTGQAAIGSQRDGLLAISSDQEQVKPIASMAKVVTALSVLEKSPLQLAETGDIYTITAADVAIYNSYIAKFGSVMPVRVGQQLTQYQMLQALMLPSANNIADSLTIWLFGSEKAYIEYANQLVKSWGLDHTTIADASGFSPSTVSTPSDLIAIGQRALNNPVLAEIVATKQAAIPDSGIIRNTNRLLLDENSVGIKTGTTDEAGSCLLFAFKHGPGLSETLIGVVMGQPNWPSTLSNARTLRDSALQQFGIVQILPAGAVVGSYDTPWGQQSDIVSVDEMSVYDWKGRAHEVSLQFESPDSPVKKGQIIGKARVVGMKHEVDLVANSEIKPPNTWWRLTNYW